MSTLEAMPVYPSTGTSISSDEYLRRAEEPGIEFVNGQFVEHHMSRKAGRVTATIIRLLGNSAADGSAEVYSENVAYRCFAEEPKRFRKPDASILRTERLPGSDAPDAFTHIPPDLAVEVISPTNIANAVIEKVEEYLHNGFGCVWVVYPTTRSVTIYRADGTVAYLHENDEITGEKALPAFRCKVGEFFGPKV